MVSFEGNNDNLDFSYHPKYTISNKTKESDKYDLYFLILIFQKILRLI